jgi:DNA-binding transcriptional LysR family regulator
MNSTALNLFKTVAETGSISAAARQLHCVSSNVTTRLKQLETSLDVSLFIREKNRLHITPEGQLLLRYANKIMALLEEAQLSMQGTKPRVHCELAPWRRRQRFACRHCWPVFTAKCPPSS